MTLPGRLADWKGRHAGATVVVCGCGRSLRDFAPPPDVLTIGVNDVGRVFTPDYLVVVNERRQFAPGRFEFVEQSQAKAVFSQLELGHPRLVRFRLGQRGGVDRGDSGTLHYSNNSPYVAVELARVLGAARVGLVGIDFDDDHFFGTTGRHPLAGQLAQIDREYARLAAACQADGVELVNLSPTSRLTSLPRMGFAEWLAAGTAPRPGSSRRVFFVHYRFLSCGTVFETGLREAAAALGLDADHAYWDDAALEQRVARYDPELLFVVHGRRFVQRFARRLRAHRSAVWLLDEPYEVDDTSIWSSRFDLVFTNDVSTLHRHRGAHELPVAYAPSLHHPGTDDKRVRRVGFVGGANPTRERLLAGLARRGLLDHVVGGPWREAVLGPLCLAANVPAERTAELYRQTEIVVNVFRDRHHFNRDRIEPTAMNPRICEALACGALVVSEPRAGVATLVPELPTFKAEADAATQIERFLAHPPLRAQVQATCAARLAHASYVHRLSTVMDALAATSARGDAPPITPPAPPAAQSHSEGPAPGVARAPARCPVLPEEPEWEDAAGVSRGAADGSTVIEPGSDRGPARERGLASVVRFEDAELVFEARLEPGACLIAKLRHANRGDAATNSYHLHAEKGRAFVARHNHVLRHLEAPGDDWTAWRFACRGDELTLWRDGNLVARVHDGLLAAGYAFVGAQGGTLRLRGLALAATRVTAEAAQPPAAGRDTDADTVIPVRTERSPRVSIVTTVYDRVDCLLRCIASVRRLAFHDYEHLIVADAPSPGVVAELRAAVDAVADPRIGLSVLKRRFNNWGIAPAEAGLVRARGEFVAFLSDDNGYTPDHFGPLIAALDRDRGLGFVYSSCRYDGRLVLNHPVPRPGRIDLGQPLFRRALFAHYFGNRLPFDMMAWDWHLVEALMQHGVRWRHVDRPSFVFRLAKYPELIAA